MDMLSGHGASMVLREGVAGCSDSNAWYMLIHAASWGLGIVCDAIFIV